MATAPLHSKVIGRLFVGFSWSPDGKWDWISDVGDKYADFMRVATCRRGYELPTILLVTLGPMCLSFALVEE